MQSARFAGPEATDEANNAKLLRLMEEVPEVKRGARFRCVVAIATPEGRVEVAEGVCEGRLTRAERGAEGFGYDPLFLVPAYGLTLRGAPRRDKERHQPPRPGAGRCPWGAGGAPGGVISMSGRWWAARLFLLVFALGLLAAGLAVISRAQAAVEWVYGAAISLFGAGLAVAGVVSLARGLGRTHRR